jgi:hypothetical protein
MTETQDLCRVCGEETEVVFVGWDDSMGCYECPDCRPRFQA